METTTPNNILVIDDDTELCELLGKYLYSEGFNVDTVHDGQSGIERALSGEYTLVILDVMLPGLDGFEVLRQLRSQSAIPVIMLTAKGEEVDRIVGLELGADDYLPKPFNPRELLARLKAIQRRIKLFTQNHPEPLQRQILSIGDVQLHLSTMSLLQNGKEIRVTAAEFYLLRELLLAAGKVISREELAQKVLGRQLAMFDRSIDVHIASLRKKLGHEFEGTERIKTIRGAGYMYTGINSSDISNSRHRENEQ